MSEPGFQILKPLHPPQAKVEIFGNESMLMWALEYARQGWYVLALHSVREGACTCGKIDCGSAGKHPRYNKTDLENGVRDATCNEKVIERWWQRWPEANIGIATGQPSGIIAFDIDPRNGGGDSLSALVQEYGPLPETLTASTGGGGSHVLFQHPGGKVKNSSSLTSLGSGLDIKADGGYIVAAPSIHATGRPYQWAGISTSLPDQLRKELALAPKWLLDLILTTPDNLRTLPAGVIQEGGRNLTLMSLGGSMRRQGMTHQAIESALLAENRERCNPTLSEVEVRRIAKNVASYAPAKHQESSLPHDEDVQVRQSNWPNEPQPEAYYGIAGEFVRLVEPHSESDPVALLVQFLTCFGNMIGRQAHFKAEADKHFTNLFTVLVGKTAKGRKGTSLGQVQRLLAFLDPSWRDKRVKSGLASGEGLIWVVRDEISETNGTDHGENDKRLLIVEPEFARVLQVNERETNTLSAIIRQAWDCGELRTLTKKQAACSTGAHISIIGHITRDELRKLLSSTEAANGFANRFLWVCVKRSKCLPEGGDLQEESIQPIVEKLQSVMKFVGSVEELRRDEDARKLWRQVYPALSEGRPGMLGAVTSRAEAQTMRLACLYALLDSSAVVRIDHLKAALAIWKYCEDSARYVFGSSLGDAIADEILRELAEKPEGMTRTQIREHFSRNKTSAQIGRALDVLLEHGMVRVEKACEQENQVRPTERWFSLTAVRH